MWVELSQTCVTPFLLWVEFVLIVIGGLIDVGGVCSKRVWQSLLWMDPGKIMIGWINLNCRQFERGSNNNCKIIANV